MVKRLSYLPDISGVPPNIVRELEALRSSISGMNSRLDMVQPKPLSIEEIRAALQVDGSHPLNVTNLLGTRAGAAAAATTTTGPQPSTLTAHPMTLTGNITIPVPAGGNGSYHHYLIKQDAVGGHTITWNAAFDFQGPAEQPRPDANGVSSFLFYKESGTVMRSVIFHRL